VVAVTGGVGVIADNTWRAFQAARGGRIRLGPGALPRHHGRPLAGARRQLHDDALDSRKRDDGDVDISFAETGEIISAEYRAPYLAHAPLEPISAIVRIDEDGAEVWTGTQIPRFVQNNVGKIAGIDPDQVKVHVLYMGGSFGHRLEDEVVKQAAEIAVQMKGTPVKLTYSREEDMTHDFPARSPWRGCAAWSATARSRPMISASPCPP
jgi:isoquinoline 1-oxidoreductase beta subunit